MSFAYEQPLWWLQTPSDTVAEDCILVIIRNMAGQDLGLSVKKLSSVLGLRFHIGEMLRQDYQNIKLMLNFEPLDKFTRFCEIQSVLEANGNVIHLLVDEPEIEPLQHDFVCPNCLRECYKSDCVEWDSDPERRCRDCGDGHKCCYMLDDDEA